MVTVHNRVEYLAESLDSVLAQEYAGAVEVIVIDDGSDEPVGPRFGPLYPTVTFVRQPNRGLGAARQAGSALATGEFVGFQDDDDLWRPDKLAKQVGFLLDHPELSAVASDVGHFVGDGPADNGYYRSSSLYRAAESRQDATTRTRVYARGALVTPTFLAHPFFAQSLVIRRQTLMEIGGWNESVKLYSECFDLFYRLTSAHEVGYLNEVTVEIRRGHSHMTKDVVSFQWGESRNLLKWSLSLTGADRRAVSPLLVHRFLRIGLQRFRTRDTRCAVGISVLAVPLVLRAPIALLGHARKHFSGRSPWRHGTPTSSLGDPGPSAWSPG